MVRARVCVLSAAFVATFVLLANAASADSVKLGVRAGYYTKVEDPFLGAELLVRVARRVYFNPNFEYVFVPDGSYWTLNADFHYDFVANRQTYVWLGGGLGIVHVAPGPANSETDAAANFLGGVGFRAGSVIPYFQVKLIAKSDAEFAVAFGLRF